MRFFAKPFALVLSATLLCASLTFDAGANAQTPAPSTPPQQPQATPTQTPTPTPTPTPTATPTPPASAAGAEDDREDVEQVETNVVNVLFNAVDKNRRFVTTIGQEDVRVFENDEPQTISLFERETNLPLSLAILIDTSSSQARTLSDEKDAAHAFIDSVIRPDRDKVAIVSFTGDATIEQDLTGDRASLHAAIERIEIPEPATKDEEFIYERAEQEAARTGIDNNPGLRGSTAIWDAVWATATDMLSQTPERTRRAIILLSDGVDSTSRLKKEAAIEAVVGVNAVVYAIGIGDDEFDEGALKKLSERTGGHAFIPEDEIELNAAFGQIQQELRTQYLISYSPTNKARDNTFRRLRIDLVNPELRKQKLKLTYRNGYFARPPAARVKIERPPKARLARPRRPPKKK
ncbi:MAG TPA: VWA domain-containing protein [Pyrinomonadaceae bacterium]|jgi:VWFA-related protein|nr:VWA domain-containing protein [Pyrinomonadaceae bacterium]